MLIESLMGVGRASAKLEDSAERGKVSPILEKKREEVRSWEADVVEMKEDREDTKF